MDQSILVRGYLAENESKINKRLSHFILAFLILCPAILIANAVGIISLCLQELVIACVLVVVLPILPAIALRYCSKDAWNRRVCLTTLEILVCIIACNGIMEIKVLFVAVPIVSILYVRKDVFLRTAAICLIAMLLLKTAMIYFGQQTDGLQYVFSRESYKMLIEISIEYIIVMIILYFACNRMYEMIDFGYHSEKETAEEKMQSVNQSQEISRNEIQKSYDLEGIFLEVDQTIDRLIRRKDKKHILNVDSDLPARLIGDSEKIKSAMIHILSDLVQFTQKGEVKLEVTYEKGIVPKKGQNITVVCKINCSENLTEYLTQGTALGFVQAEKMIQELNGVIVRETGENQSTCYTVSFQQIVDSEATILQVKEMHREEQKKLIYDSRKKVQNILYAKEVKVLVVDDSDVTQKLINAILKSYGMRSVCVSSGEEAIEKLKTKAFDFVILDHMMPIKGGIQIAKEIRQLGEPYYEMLPLMAMTSNTTKESKQMFRDNGFTEVISKPIKEDELRQAIAHCMFL